MQTERPIFDISEPTERKLLNTWEEIKTDKNTCSRYMREMLFKMGVECEVLLDVVKTASIESAILNSPGSFMLGAYITYDGISSELERRGKNFKINPEDLKRIGDFNRKYYIDKRWADLDIISDQNRKKELYLETGGPVVDVTWLCDKLDANGGNVLYNTLHNFKNQIEKQYRIEKDASRVASSFMNGAMKVLSTFYIVQELPKDN